MWWETLRNQLKKRACRWMFLVPTSVGIILCVIYYILAVTGSFPSSFPNYPEPIYVIIAALIPGILFAIGGVNWFLEPRHKGLQTCCHHCGFR